MKRVLIITYYWPPSGGAGVQRWLRFVKRMRDFGWEPLIYTVDNPNYALLDEGLVNEVPENVKIIKHPIKEPNNLFSKKKSKGNLYKLQEQKGNTRSFIQKVSWFIRGNFFIPDARFMWIKPSVRVLYKIIKEENIDLIVSTGPPHSLHLIGKKLKEKLNIPWIADFRDPWTSMDYLDEMFLTNFAKNKHARLEKQVITSADKVVVVGRTMYNEFLANHKVESSIIYNGFEQEANTETTFTLDAKFSIVHIGSFLKNRNCIDLWTVLAELVFENEEFKEHLEIKLIGNVAPIVLESIDALNLTPYLNRIEYVPFEETQSHLHSAQTLLLPIDRIPNAEFVLTGKLFEYLKSKRPVLLIGPIKGDAADIVENCNAGYSCNFDDKQMIKNTVLKMFNLYLKKENKIDSINVNQFSGAELTREMTTLFDTLVSEKK